MPVRCRLSCWTRFFITNPCGNATTLPVSLTVLPPGDPGCGPTCDAIDFNNDGLFPDTLDIDSLLSVFSGGPCL